VCLGALGLGALSKENAWLAPVLVLLAEYGPRRQGGRLIRGRLDALPLVAAAGLALAAAAMLATGTGPVYEFVAASYEGRDFDLAERLLTQPRVLLFHVTQLVWPAPGRFSVDHEVILSTGLLSPPRTLLALVVLVSWTLAGIWLMVRGRGRVAGFLMLWPVLMSVPESGPIGIEMIFEHRVYLPSVGLFGLVGLGVARASDGPYAGPTLLAGSLALVVCAWSTASRVPEWRTDLSLYEAAARFAPDSSRVQNNLGIGYARVGRYGEAEAAFTRAISLAPEHLRALANRGELYARKLNRPALALQDFDRASALAPDDVSLLLSRSAVQARLGRAAAALADLDRALVVDPGDPVVRNTRGVLRLELGDAAGARADFSHAIGARPGQAAFWVNRADAEARLGRRPAALRDLAGALARAGAAASVALRVADAYRKLGEPGLAASALAEACKLGALRACAPSNDSVAGPGSR
jgi:Flp pilus assembly protein TadD